MNTNRRTFPRKWLPQRNRSNVHFLHILRILYFEIWIKRWHTIANIHGNCCFPQSCGARWRPRHLCPSWSIFPKSKETRKRRELRHLRGKTRRSVGVPREKLSKRCKHIIIFFMSLLHVSLFEVLIVSVLLFINGCFRRMQSYQETLQRQLTLLTSVSMPDCLISAARSCFYRI